MDFSLNITPRVFSGIKAKIPETNYASGGVGNIMSAQEFKYRKSGSSLAFDVYKLPDSLSNTIFKLGKALIADDKQRHIYSEGYNQTLNFLKSVAKTVK